MDAVGRGERALLVDASSRRRRRAGSRTSAAPAMPGLASTDWVVTSDSCPSKFR